MPPRIGPRNKIAGELRRSQTVTTFGCGSIVDLPRLSGIVSGIDDWPVDNLPSSSTIHEQNLEKILDKEFFRQVSSPESESSPAFGIPIYRFPLWYYCPTCHKLDYYNKISRPISGNTNDNNKELVCNSCSTDRHPVKLIPSRFIAACLNGHIEDFPYVWWVHRGKGTCTSPKLQLHYDGRTGGLEGIEITCETCKAEATMAGCMDKSALRGLQCKGNRPWLGNGLNGRGWNQDPTQCHAALRVLQRSANNVYYPINQSALTIPPWSNYLQTIIREKVDLFEDVFEEDSDTIILKRLSKIYNRNPAMYGGNLETFIKLAYAQYGDGDGEQEERSLREDEYKAFCGADVDDMHFSTKSVDVPEEFQGLISQIKLAKKLREVMVLQGFRRILPSSDTDDDGRKELGLSDEDFSPISKKTLPWLPAIELFGEGIFIKLDESAVSAWEESVSTRYSAMGKRHDGDWIGNGMFNPDMPRYVLLHTLSHLLIRQLTAQCGYATASIKEKIFSSLTNSTEKMCGILIYTSATDTDGSLGGLVREGQTQKISDTLKNMLEECSWCSNDPVCIDATFQGHSGLNYAACHACALLPETSCESFNCLLDRAAITGTPDNPELAYFKNLL